MPKTRPGPDAGGSVLARIGTRQVRIPDGRVTDVRTPKEKSRYDSKMEAAHADYLTCEAEAGRIRRYWYHPLVLRLANGARYTPDFLVWYHDSRLEFQEIKGHHQNLRDSLTHLKWAASITPWATFKMFTKERGIWKETEIQP